MSACGSSATGNRTPSVAMNDLAVAVPSKLSTPMTRIRASAPPRLGLLPDGRGQRGELLVAARAPGPEEQQHGGRAVAAAVGGHRHLALPDGADVGGGERRHRATLVRSARRARARAEAGEQEDAEHDGEDGAHQQEDLARLARAPGAGHGAAPGAGAADGSGGDASVIARGR